MEAQRIEADLNSILPPSAAGAIARFQDEVKSDLLRLEAGEYQQSLGEQRSEALAKIATQRDRGAKNVTASIHDGNGRTGLTLKQLQDALQHGKFKTIPPLHAREVYKAEVAIEGGGYTDPGKFMAAWTRAFDAPADSPTRNRFLDSIGADKLDRADRARFFDALSTDMLQTEMSARRDDRADKSAFKPRVHEVSGPDARRLDVTAAMLKSLGKPGSGDLAERMTDRVSERSLTDTSGTGMRSDVAQAMAAHTGQQSPDAMHADLSETYEAATSETLL